MTLWYMHCSRMMLQLLLLLLLLHQMLLLHLLLLVRLPSFACTLRLVPVLVYSLRNPSTGLAIANTNLARCRASHTSTNTRSHF